MKMYRVMTKLQNGCYSPGFYHEDRNFLVEAMKQSLAQYPAEETAGITFFIEETELNMDLVTLQATPTATTAPTLEIVQPTTDNTVADTTTNNQVLN